MGKYPDEEANMYERAEQLRSTLLRPYELQVEKATKELTIELARRQNEQELDLDDMEFKFGDIGHGLVAIQTFEDIETTCDVLNGCESSPPLSLVRANARRLTTSQTPRSSGPGAT